MKKYILPLAIAAMTVSLVSCAPSYAVRERPREVVYARPAPPSRDYVWVGGDWVWTGGRYQWHEGRWDRPRRNSRWQDGHWQDTRRGSKWVPGRWQR